MTIEEICEDWVARWDSKEAGRGGGGDFTTAATAIPRRGVHVQVGASFSEAEGGFDFAVIARNSLAGNLLWKARVDAMPGWRNLHDIPLAVTTSRDGRRVFVTGVVNATDFAQQSRNLTDASFPTKSDLGTVAIRSSDGSVLWKRVHRSAGLQVPSAIAAVRGVVVVTAGERKGRHPSHILTEFYDADTGVLTQRIRHKEPAGDSVPLAMSADRKFGRVVVTGFAQARGHINPDFPTPNRDFATIAYVIDGSRSRQLWSAHYDGGAKADDVSTTVVVNPRFGIAFVSGESHAPDWRAGFRVSEMTTVAYEMVSGQRLWVSRRVTVLHEQAGATASVADNSHIIVAGYRVVPSTTSGQGRWDSDYVTVAYDIHSGKELWQRIHGTPGYVEEIPADIVRTPRGVAVIGHSFHSCFCQSDFLTLSYAKSGEMNWVARFNTFNGFDYNYAIAGDISGGKVLVAGTAIDHVASLMPTRPKGGNIDDFVTVAYSSR